GDTTRWYQPGRFWPIPASPDEAGIGVLEQMFLSMGYRDCGGDDSLEPGYEKVALYGYALFYTHAARQLPTGKWTSRLGPQQDIEHHSPHDVTGPAYGEVAQVMKRPLQPVS